MKKLLFLGIVMMGMLSSCVKDAASGTPDPQKAKEEAYNNAFVQTFGKIAPNQTWGFAQGMRSAYPNGNMWESDGYTIPAAITADEIAKVRAVFDLKGEEKYESLVDWDCFFVQQVYKGVAHYTAGNGGDVLGSAHMDWLCAYDPVGVQETQYVWNAEKNDNDVFIVTNHDDHINKFNAGTCESSAVSEKTGKTIKGMQLMVESSTQRFGFSSSLDNGHVFYNFRMEEINGNYYVGFDFEAAGQNKSEQVARDYIYNDWIVKIVPGKGQSRKVKQEGLIICEDLGTIGDFDFNDVVFYAKVWNDGVTEIWLLAAGGTLNLSVAGREVHEAFGVGQTTMVNTEESTGKGAKKDPVYFVAENTYSSLIEIPVVVRTKDAAGNVTSYELSAEMGKAPQKICVPKGFKWCKEYKSLAEVYPGFKSWTTGAADTWTGTGSYDADNVCDYEFAY
jgi:hypothetical protein